MLVIAALTDHCCHLIVKTKHHGIDKMMKKRKVKTPNHTQHGQYSSYDSMPQENGLEDDEDESAEHSTFIGRNADCEYGSDEDDDFETVKHSDAKEHMATNMSYGDVGKLAYGAVGVAVVNFCIALTQFGFCVNYFIFIGNTIHSLFPVHLCFNESDTRICRTIHDDDVKKGIGMVQEVTTWPVKLSDAVNSTTAASVISNVTDLTTISPNVTTSTPNITNVTIAWTEIGELIYTAPDLRILVVCPIIVFIIFALIRSVRYLGVISVLANLSILFGCVSVFIFLIIGELS